MPYTAAFGSRGGGPASQTLERPAPAAAPTPALPKFLGELGGPPAPLAAGSTDPAYLAYLRSLEYQRQVANLGAQRQLQNLQGQMVIGPEQIAAAGVIERRGIDQAAESRGIFRSGERLQGLGDERKQEAQKLAALRLAGAGQYGNILTNLQMQLAGLSNTAADNAVLNEARQVVP